MLNLICSAGAFIPYVLAEREKIRIIWQPFKTLPSVAKIVQALASSSEGGAAFEARVVDCIASGFLTELVRRRFLAFRGSFYQYGSGNEYRELLNLFFQGIGIDVFAPARRGLPEALDRWLSVLHIDFTAYRYSFTVKSVNTHQAAFFDEQHYALSMEIITEGEEGTAQTSLSQCTDTEILRAPTALSHYLPEIQELFNRPWVQLPEERLLVFLDSAAGLLTRLGIQVNLSKALLRELNPRLVIKGKSVQNQASLVRYLDLDTLQNFEWQMAIGDEVLTPDEFQKLVKEKRAVIRFKDGFIKIDTEAFSRLLKKAKNAAPDFNDFIKAHCTGDTILAFDARETIDNLFTEHNFPVPVALNAVLRPYQQRGYNWVCSLLFSGFGCILADDMGLGKTIQSIAALLRLKEEGLLGNGCLIIAPAALLYNWEKELDRFAPSLGVSRYHGNQRRLDCPHEPRGVKGIV